MSLEKIYPYLLFDADDTLFDFAAAEDEMLTRSLLHFGLPPDPARKERYRVINRAMWRAFDRGEVSQEELVVERYRRFLAQEGVAGDPAAWNDFGLHCLSEAPALLPGAEELCRALAGRYTLALVTNGVPFVQRGRLERSPLGAYFGPRVYISGEMGCRKPQRAFFDRVLAELGAGRGECLVIGDSLTSDIQGAADSGLACVWLNPRGLPAGEAAPTWTVGSLAELSQLLL